MIEIKIDENIDVRLDQYLSEQTEYSRSQIKNLINDKKITVNGSVAKSSMNLKAGDVVKLEEMVLDELSAEPEEMALDIVYEDNDVIVVNKGNGVVVHPAVGNNHGTLVNGLMYHSKNLSDINGEFRPGIVHRIDAYTTGLLVVAKNNQAHEFLAQQLENKTTHRKYIALVWGAINNQTGTIDAPIGRDEADRKKMAVTANNSKNAVTHFKVLERFNNATLIEVKLETGRTHQIRVHMNYIGHPVVNDPVYGNKKLIDESGQCLHAKELGFVHPKTKEYVEFNSELPECFMNILNQFKEEE
ncbi:MAG: RluA family pseudouridine synthase [Firmicutes bacterium]|nr:RluA family pseudouridine synthase [Bacillota bacterium]